MNKIEIAASFSKKIQIRRFEPVEFFASAKQEVYRNQADKTYKELSDWCKLQVHQQVMDYLADVKGDIELNKKARDFEREDVSLANSELDLIDTPSETEYQESGSQINE